ncbi:MAG: NAD(P)-dependent alcohol dehydrogenase [Alphaproteobacteria bacterium]|nr:NAD(P)-dependent alcohol dehydrogenase [Alphaproteobacteria bacterium]
MQAAVYTQYGPPSVVSIQNIAQPEPKATEVLIRIHASAVNSGDMRARSLDMPKGFGFIGRLVFGLTGPRKPVLGVELSGVIESVGDKVSAFKPGDKIFAAPEGAMGGHAEFQTLRKDAAIALIPKGCSFETAAVISFGGITALQFLRDKGEIKRGDKVLVNGASGTVGLAAVQLAKHFGAHVSGVCSGRNAQLVRSIGADVVIDYTTADFTEGGARYDLILDAAGTAPWSRARPVLTKTGRLLLVNGSLCDMLCAPFVSRKNGKRLMAGVAMGNAKDLRFLADLVAKGVFTPIIDRTYPLSDIALAHAYVDTGRKKGSVVISVV